MQLKLGAITLIILGGQHPTRDIMLGNSHPTKDIMLILQGLTILMICGVLQDSITEIITLGMHVLGITEHSSDLGN
jgi:hypothetical protein